MDRKKLIKRLGYLILFIFFVNFLADKFYWYYSMWYLDMFLHFLGGFWIGLLFFYLFPMQNISTLQIFQVLFFVLLVGIGWEVFEAVVNNAAARNYFNFLDTLSDIFFDLSGGTVAIFYFLKKIVLQLKNGKNC